MNLHRITVFILWLLFTGSMALAGGALLGTVSALVQSHKEHHQQALLDVEKGLNL